jgi:hypothetical protein
MASWAASAFGLSAGSAIEQDAALQLAFPLTFRQIDGRTTGAFW